MQSTHQSMIRQSTEHRHTETSNIFTKSIPSRLYESIQFGNSSLVQGKTYDAQYRQGFPRLYAFESSVQGKSRLSLDGKSKYSFRNDYSQIVEENLFLRQEVSRLGLIIETERRNAVSISELERLGALLVQRDTEIRTLNERIFVLQNKTSQVNQSNEWQVRYNESQIVINQLNVRVSQLTQQLSQYEGRISQLSQQINAGAQQQYEAQINQLNVRISQLTQQLSSYESQISQFKQQGAGSSSQYESQIQQLNITINQYKQQISQLTIQNSEYKSQIVQLEQQATSAKSSSRNDVELNELRQEISSLNYKIEQYELHISQYEKTFAQYESQITTLQQVNWKLEERISKEIKETTKEVPVPSQVDDEKWIIEEGKLNFKIIILLEQINRLKQKEQELTVKSEELHAYLLKAENYIEQIQMELEKNNLRENIPAHIVEKVTLLEQENIKYTRLVEELQSRLSVTQVSAVSDDEYHATMGERDLRIIILLEEINRLNQKVVEIRQYLVQAEDFIEQLQRGVQEREAIIPPEVENQIHYLSDQNHRLNLLIENYINQIKHLKVNVQVPSAPKIEYQVPVEIENRLALLAAQNQRLSRLIIELQNKPATVQTRVETKVEYQVPVEIETRLSLLAAENERLSRLVVELQNKPAIVQTKVETKIEYKIPADVETRLTTLTQENSRLNSLVIQLQNRPTQQIVQPQADISLLESQYAKTKFRTIVLLEEINRLNTSLQEVTGYLVNAENFIFELENRLAQPATIVETHTITNTNTVEVVPDWIEKELAKMTLQRIFLMEEINRLNHEVKEIHSHLINAENYIEQCEIRFNEINTQHIQTTVEFRIPPEIEARISQLTQENQSLNRALIEIQNRPARVETKIEQKVEFRIPPEIEAKISLLAAENQRIERELSLRSKTVQQDESLALEYGKLHFRTIILLEEINRLNFVVNELKGFLANAENYIFEIENRQQVPVPAEIEEEMMHLRQENQKLHAEINRISLFFEQQINQYKVEINNINIQLQTFKSEATTYKSRVSELERISSSVSSSLSQSAKQELEKKWAAEHFRVIVLLEEVNRLNKKCEDIDKERVEVIGHLIRAENFIQELQVRCAQLEETSVKHSTITTHSTANGSERAIQELGIQIGDLQNARRIEIAARDLRIIFLLEEINRLNHKIADLSSSEGSGSSEQILALRQQNEQCQAELHEVLGHLRNAEDYISELLRQSEGFAMERDHLINELNRLRR